jgi:DNA-directed RNA polymerase sigma subunit (sigma70/sigma32)
MSEREQLILSLYYQEELTMKEISQVVGIVVSRVSQIHAAAMVKLRASLSHLREGATPPISRMQAVCQGADHRQARRQP